MKKNTILAALAVLPFLTSSLALADGNWKQSSLTSSEGANIQINYQTAIQNSGVLNSATVATPVWINISGGNTNANSQVQVVLMNFEQTGERGGFYGPYNQISSETLSPQFQNGNFSVQTPSPITIYSYHCNAPFFDSQENNWDCNEYTDGESQFQQQIAIVVDGQCDLPPVFVQGKLEKRRV
jgi:hypothetical protein